MPIVVNLDVMLAKRKMSLTELSEKVDIAMPNLSILKTGKARAIRFFMCRPSAARPREWSRHVGRLPTRCTVVWGQSDARACASFAVRT